MKRLLLPLALLLFVGCDSAGPDDSPTALELLTAHRWYSHGHVAVDIATGDEYPEGEFLLPDWYEFDAEGVARSRLLGEVSEVPYTLAQDGRSFVAVGATFHIEELTESVLRFRYEIAGTRFTVTTRPTQPD